MKIAFLIQQCVPFHGLTLNERPLGGTETAVIRLAEALFSEGHEVLVLTPVSNPPLTNVLYLPLTAYSQLGSVDLAIVVRDWNLLMLPIEARQRLFWTGDSYDQPLTFGIGDKRVQSRMDGLLCVSEWHRRTFGQATGIPLEKIQILRNGVALELFQGEEERCTKRLFYSSTPYRGLQYLPEIFAAIQSRVTDAELHIFSGYEAYAGTDGERAERELNEIRARFHSMPQVRWFGNIRQQELARAMMSSGILVYPNIFEETSCITVMEAKTAGCGIVTSALGALPETVGEGGYLIPGHPSEGLYREKFVEAVCSLLLDDARRNALSKKNREEALQSLSWKHRAGELMELVVKLQAFST